MPRLLAFVVSVSVVLLSVAPAIAATIQTDLWVYNNGDTVTVYGDGFTPGEPVELVTTDPQGIEVDRGTVGTDEYGNLTYQFVLRATVEGIYDVNATGLTSGLTAWTQFDPANVTISAAAFTWYRTQGPGFDVAISGTWQCTGTCTSAQSVLVEARESDGANNAASGSVVASQSITSLSGTTWTTTFQFRGNNQQGSFAIPHDRKFDIRAVLNFNNGSTSTAVRDNYFGVDNTRPTSTVVTVDPNGSGGKLTASGTAADDPAAGGVASGLSNGEVYVEIRSGSASGATVSGTGQNVNVSGAGSWSYTVTSPPTAAGTYCVVSIATDVAGNVQNPVASKCYVVAPTNTAPTISDIPNQTIDEDGTTGALSFTIGDPDTAISALTVSGSSSNTTLVPNANISFGGSGANRTVTVTPAAN
ncbi:MAG: hypothetical protein M3295_08020, partial [Chloroflexota bacterium]|nr:hypothetical protein [Chloroflexota bacterium]